MVANRNRLLAAAAVIVLIVGAIAAYSRSSSSSHAQIREPLTTTTAPSDSTTTETTDTTLSPSESVSSVPDTVPSTTTTPATSAPPPLDCTPDDLEAVTATDKPAYALGETVTITVSIRNRSDRACVIQPRQRYPYTFGSPVKITDPNGALIWRHGARAAGSFARIDPFTLAPGDSYMWATAEWDQHFCQGPCASDQPAMTGSSDSSWDEGTQVSPGSYRALPADETPAPATTVTPASFELTP